MELAVPALALCVMGYLLWRADRRHDSDQKLLTATLDEWSSDRERLLEQLEKVRTDRVAEIASERQEFATEREKWSRERAQLLNRIQRPSEAVYEHFEPTDLRQGVNPEDDDAYWAAVGVTSGDS